MSAEPIADAVSSLGTSFSSLGISPPGNVKPGTTTYPASDVVADEDPATAHKFPSANPPGHSQSVGSSLKKRSLPHENPSISPKKKRQRLEVPSSDRTTRSMTKDQELGKVQSLIISPPQVNNQGSVLKDVQNSAATPSASSTSVKMNEKTIETSSPASITRNTSNLPPESVKDKPEGLAMDPPASDAIHASEIQTREGNYSNPTHQALENSHEQENQATGPPSNGSIPPQSDTLPTNNPTEEDVSRARYQLHRTLWSYIVSLCQVQRHELRDKIKRRQEAEEAELGLSLDDLLDVNALAMTELEEAEYLFQSCGIDLSGDLDSAVNLLTDVSTLHPDVQTVYHLLQVCKVWKDAFPTFQEFCLPIELAFREGSLLRRLDELLPPYELAKVLYETIKSNLRPEI
ncbi:hypothetical protein BDN72DRAFT_847474 [Pluteus cervinus]|uniref:Uncharacterized protein n=1 Tax=Pluteus cervinus TaxID=181527 RepID=A0ACD3AFE1_9AGAR|nr:hypothetical protein BDN72DRAFT_847474 [Pluteus cervinus]